MKFVSYWVFPVLSGLIWLGTLLGLFLHWVIDTHETKYPSMQDNQTIAYISDVGAAELKPLFVVGCVLTTIFLDTSFILDRLLRHKGVLVPNTSLSEKVLSGLCIFFAFVGTIGLTFLSGFDTAHYPRLHDIFLLLFIAGYLLSAIFICWEFQRLAHKNRQHRILTLSFWVKLVFIVVELALAILFIVSNFRDNYNRAAIVEWVVALIFSFYVFSFAIDLWPAVRVRHGQNGDYDLRPLSFGEVEEAAVRDTHDSERTLTDNNINNNNSHYHNNINHHPGVMPAAASVGRPPNHKTGRAHATNF